MAPELRESEWERVLWKRQPFPDNYVPRIFLSSLSTNGKIVATLSSPKWLTYSAANFRPYTYESLVLASCTISLHLSIIFTFLAVFVRLRERTLDPRLLVWISIVSFMCFYTLWEIVEYTGSDTSRFIDRRCHFSSITDRQAHFWTRC